MRALLVSLVVLISLSIFLGGCRSVSPQSRKEADFSYKMGMAYLNEGKLQMAYVEFHKALQLDPYNKDILNSLGIVYLQLDNIDRAQELFTKAISEDAAFSEAHTNLGLIYLKKRQWDAAIGSFNRAISNSLYVNPEKAYYYLGITYYRKGDMNNSAEAFRNALRRAPQFHLPYYGLALVSNKTGQYGEAAAYLSKAIEMDPAYRGDKAKFLADVKKNLPLARQDDLADLRDYLEIAHY